MQFTYRPPTLPLAITRRRPTDLSRYCVASIPAARDELEESSSDDAEAELNAILPEPLRDCFIDVSSEHVNAFIDDITGINRSGNPLLANRCKSVSFPDSGELDWYANIEMQQSTPI